MIEEPGVRNRPDFRSIDEDVVGPSATCLGEQVVETARQRSRAAINAPDPSRRRAIAAIATPAVCAGGPVNGSVSTDTAGVVVDVVSAGADVVVVPSTELVVVT